MARGKKAVVKEFVAHRTRCRDCGRTFASESDSPTFHERYLADCGWIKGEKGWRCPACSTICS